MMPSVVFYIFELLLCLLCIVIIMPVSYFIFWEETREHYVNFARDWLKLEHSDPQMLVITLWFALSLGTGAYCAIIPIETINQNSNSFFFSFSIAIHWYCTAVIFSLYKSMKHENERQTNSVYNVPAEKA